MSAVVTKQPAPSPDATAGLYDKDLYAWVQQQVAALREGRVGDLDLENLAEEIHDLGSEQIHKLRSSFRIILLHMLKWDHQPNRRTRSWTTSIRSHRAELEDVTHANPSLRPRRAETMLAAYRRARIEAAGEMRQPERSLPPECPYSLDEVLNRPFDWPEE